MGSSIAWWRGGAVPSSLVLLGALSLSLAAAAAPVTVRFPEGSIRGFITLRTPGGQSLAQGELSELLRGDEIHKTTVLRFQDGSLFEEKVVFSQKGVYRLLRYDMAQRGPAFTEDTRLSLVRATSTYRVETTPHKGRSPKVKIHEGRLDLPQDTYNGMVPTILRDLPKGAGTTVHFVAFTPEPRLVQLEIIPAGKQKMTLGETSVDALRFVLKVRLGKWLTLFAKLLGRMPEDAQAWLIDGDVPAFVGFQGQLYPTDPVWRIDLVSPVRP